MVGVENGFERDEVAGEVATLVMRVVDEISDRWAEVIGRSQLSAGQVRLLRYLLAEGPQSMSGVAQHLGCDPSLATAAVDRLEARDLVRRVLDPADRRIRRVGLTPAGEREVRAVWSEMRRATPVGRLDDRQLLELRSIVLAMLRSDGPGADELR